MLEYTLGELIDQLISANIRLTIFDHLKSMELKKNDRDLNKIAEWEAGARWANERRSLARNSIDEKLSQIIKNGTYSVTTEKRTFSSL